MIDIGTITKLHINLLCWACLDDEDILASNWFSYFYVCFFKTIERKSKHWRNFQLTFIGIFKNHAFSQRLYPTSRITKTKNKINNKKIQHQEDEYIFTNKTIEYILSTIRFVRMNNSIIIRRKHNTFTQMLEIL